MAGIVGYGVYVPKYRLKQADAAMPWGSWAGGEKSVCGADEDIVTMAAEAAQRAISHAGVNPADIGSIYIGTASSPYIEQYVAPILAEALELSPEATMIDYCGSVNSAANALLGCLDAIGAGRIKYGIVIGTEDRATAPGSEGETSFGAGAAAFVIGADRVIADIKGVHTYSTLFTDRWRATKDSWVSNYFDYRFDREYGYERHVAAATRGLLQKTGEKVTDFKYVVFQPTDERLPGLAARALGIKSEQLPANIVPMLGDLGSASAFISLAGVLDKAKPGEKILLASYGSGSSNAFSLVVRDPIEQKKARLGTTLEKYLAKKQYIDYVTYLKWRGNLKRVPY
jgi:hydroxymethylglutaryl-CoA synthase